MNLYNKYLNTVFSSKYFGVEAVAQLSNKKINIIPLEDETIQSFQDFSITGSNNKFIIQNTDIKSLQLVEDSVITIEDVVYLIKSPKDNLDGTTQIILEKQ